MDISWTNTTNALQDFVSVLVCGKCGCKPESPVRLTNCGHFFCHDCIISAIRCITCDVPVQPNEMKHDHLVSNLIQNCDIIAEIINKRDIWNNTLDMMNMSMDNTVSKTVSKTIKASKKQTYIPKNINKTNPKGETKLHEACLKRNAARVKSLLIAGANPNTKDNAGWTPLQEMISYGWTEICELLLEGGALPNIPGYESRRPLHEAADVNNIAGAKLLLQYKADTDVRDSHGKRPMYVYVGSRDYCQSQEKKEMQAVLMGVQESQSSSGRTSDLNQTLDKSFVSGRDRLVIFASNLKPENKKLLGLAAAKHKFKISTTMCRLSVTHIIVEANEQNITKLTLDVLFAIVRGCWLLNSEWIALALDMDNISDMDFEVFELSGAPICGVPRMARKNTEHQNPRLFNNCFVYFALHTNTTFRIDDIHLTKEDLVKLVREGGGTVLTREPDPEDLKDMSRVIPFHTASDPSHPLHRCTHYIIYMPDKNEPVIKYKMPHIKSLPLIWLIECVEKFTLVDPALLGLT